MYIDPLTLAAIKSLFPLFKACETLYETWCLTKTFGNEFFKAECMLHAQYARLIQIGCRSRDQLAEPPDPNNDFHPITQSIYELLLQIEAIFNKCEVLIQRYKRIRLKLQKRKPLDTPAAEQLQDPNPKTTNSSSTDVTTPPLSYPISSNSSAPTSMQTTISKSSSPLNTSGSTLKQSNALKKKPQRSRIRNLFSRKPSVENKQEKELLELSTQRRPQTSLRPIAQNTSSVILSLKTEAESLGMKLSENAEKLQTSMEFDRKVEWAVKDKAGLAINQLHSLSLLVKWR
ncbi:hypothetical protein M434DRAFT_39138 [Hypoxylon sp. CO27-5]|nr:hypothetical protein M434DRAFT_39138 [Hypoxylon sp. CO27-5]